MRIPLVIAMAVGAALGAPPAMADAPKMITQAFRDDFDRLDEGRWFVSDGWTNGKHQDCTWSRRALTVRDGLLTLFHLPGGSGSGPLCGEVQTRDFMQYGTFEARIRTPRGSGRNASVFTYTGPVNGAPHDEIDIEVLTRNPAQVSLNTFVDGKPANGLVVPIDPPLDGAFHTVGFRWAPEGITWYLDGRAVHRTAPGTALPDHPQKLYMSFWSTTQLTDWMGRQDKQDRPLSYQIDWIAYTPLGAPCPFEGSVACSTP